MIYILSEIIKMLMSIHKIFERRSVYINKLAWKGQQYGEERKYMNEA